MAQDHKTIVRRVFDEMFNKGDLAVADQLLAPDYVSHDPAFSDAIRGPDQFKLYVRTYRNAFPDLHLTIDDQIAEGDRVVTRFTARGTHRGELFGIEPTGNRVTTAGITFDRLVNGRIAEAWINYDMLGLMRQIGLALARRPAEPAGAEGQQPAS